MPNPAAPSMNSAKNHATSTAVIRGSDESRASARRSTSTAPVRVCSSWMQSAGKMIQRIVAAVKTASASAPPTARPAPRSA